MTGYYDRNGVAVVVLAYRTDAASTQPFRPSKAQSRDGAAGVPLDVLTGSHSPSGLLESWSWVGDFPPVREMGDLPW